MRILAAMTAALTLAGCVTAETIMLDSRTAIISAQGSGYNTQAQVVQKVLVQAATETQARGFTYFQVLDSQDTTRQGQAVIPGNSYSNTNATASCYGGYCSGNANTNSTYTPPQVINVIRPGADVRIRFYRDGEIDPNTQGVWSAADVLAAQQRP